MSTRLTARVLGLMLVAAAAQAALECNLSADTWPGGYVLNVTVANTGPAGVSGWTVQLDFDQTALIDNAWNAQVSASGNRVTAANVAYNGQLAPGQAASFGLQGRYSGAFTLPPCTPAGGAASSSVSSSSSASSSTPSSSSSSSASWSSASSVASSSSSAPAQTTLVLQENQTGFCGVDGSVDANNGGYTGAGFANTTNAAGTGVYWQVQVPAAGNYLLEWRYANGSANARPGELRVNGQAAAQVNFPSTGSWTSWTVVQANVWLPAGSVALALVATGGEGLANIDSLSLTGNGASAAPCGGGGSSSSSSSSSSAGGACGAGTAAVRIGGGPGAYTLNGAPAGGDLAQVLNDALARLTPGRSWAERIVVEAGGSLGSNSIRLPSHTVLEVCGTIDVGNRAGRGAIEAIGAENVSIPHLTMTGSPYFGLRFADVHGLHLGRIELRLSGGLGIRFERDLPGSDDVTMDEVYVSGTGNHGVETWNVDGLTIGSVVARNTAYSGLLLNNTRNAVIGLVDGADTATGTGYATFRLANEAGRIGDAWPTNIHVDRIVSRRGGRGFFCVSNSGGARIGTVDLADNGNNAILIENCHNVTIDGGRVDGGGEVRIAARSEFPNTSDVLIRNLQVFNTSVRESPCGDNVQWVNVTVQNGSFNVCD
ncbi:MAG: hypothetical protein KatS3mg121_1225 [Gammaproteobacteria bacterium]|nr:MAG: hypothetical protein KatS3mg121_1225 [Gammaproteobacteria bacterium]